MPLHLHGQDAPQEILLLIMTCGFSPHDYVRPDLDARFRMPLIRNQERLS